MRPLALVLAAVALAGCAGAASAGCLRYEPAQVVLLGRMTPSDDGGLKLRLDRPVCTLAGSGAPAVERVRTVRLVFGRLAPPMHELGGRRAAVYGSLFRGPHDDEDELRLLVTGLGRAR